MAEKIEDKVDIVDALLDCIDERQAFILGYNYLRRKGIINAEILERIKEHDARRGTSLLERYMKGTEFYSENQKGGKAYKSFLVDFER